MTDFIVLGSDTDAGKTTFSLLWLAAFSDEWGYWKPVESGVSDTEAVRRLLPFVQASSPMAHFKAAAAPPWAARLEGRTAPSPDAIAAAKPRIPGRRLLIETFGGPFSPLTDCRLQIDLIRQWAVPCLLVVSSRIGAVGRSLATLEALRAHGRPPVAVVLIGPRDAFAEEQIAKHGGIAVAALEPPAAFDAAEILASAAAQRDMLERLRRLLVPAPADNANWLDRDAAAVWHPYSPLHEADPPLLIAEAQDEYLQLMDGRRVIDGISSWWTILHGHRRPPLVAALQAALARIDHVQFAGATHPYAIELAELLLASMPWTGGRVFYSDNGSTAVEVALKMAYQFWVRHREPQRTLFVGFENGYHGDTLGAMAVGRDPVFFRDFEPLLLEARVVPLDPARLDDVLQQHRGRVAGVIVEPLVQGAGGMRVHDAGTLRELFETARRHEVLFIADEVMTGGGRTGALWAHQKARVAPDLICAAKTLAGGMMPLAATLVAPHIAAQWDTCDRSQSFFHGHSFTAHPLACAVACANWRLLTPEYLARVGEMEKRWRSRLEPLRGRPGIRDVRISGSIAAVEVDVPGGYLADAGRVMRRVALEQGVLLRPLGSVLYTLPPLGSSGESLARIADAMCAAVAAVKT